MDNLKRETPISTYWLPEGFPADKAGGAFELWIWLILPYNVITWNSPSHRHILLHQHFTVRRCPVSELSTFTRLHNSLSITIMQITTRKQPHTIMSGDCLNTPGLSSVSPSTLSLNVTAGNHCSSLYPTTSNARITQMNVMTIVVSMMCARV